MDDLENGDDPPERDVTRGVACHKVPTVQAPMTLTVWRAYLNVALLDSVCSSQEKPKQKCYIVH